MNTSTLTWLYTRTREVSDNVLHFAREILVENTANRIDIGMGKKLESTAIYVEMLNK